MLKNAKPLLKPCVIAGLLVCLRAILLHRRRFRRCLWLCKPAVNHAGDTKETEIGCYQGRKHTNDTQDDTDFIQNAK